MEIVIGIDLGTTHSLAAYIDGETPRLIPNALGEVLTPSIVGIESDGSLLVGRAAKELQVVHPDRCASLFKRRMGSDWKVELAGRTFSPEELSGLVLLSLKHDAEAHLGRPVERAVVTVPAYFNEHQRQSTLHAGRIAGLKVERIFNEPTAAALAYGYHPNLDGTAGPGIEDDAEKVLLVFDLGGGTFDVSVVEVIAGAIEVRASSGEGFLGGEDFTRTLAARILERRGVAFERAEMEAPLQVARLLQQSEVAKRALSRQETAAVRVPDRKGLFAEGAPSESISRAEFQRWTDHLVARVELPIRRVLGDAGLKRSQIDEVILVGGATRMPAIVSRVTELFDRPPLCRINPDEVVALGAAIQAGLFARAQSLDDLVVTDVAPFTLGISISKQFGQEHRKGYYLPIIGRNTTIPVSRVNPVATVEPNQTDMSIEIYQGEGRRVEDNLKLGHFKITGIPRGPAGQQVEVRFTYDLNGVLEVEATVSATKQVFTHVVTQHARGLSPAQVAKAVAAMQALKSHPREDAVNRLLLRRAERLFAELPAPARTILGDLLDGFEEALELNDPAAVERHRQELRRFLDRHEPGMEGDDERGGGDDAW
jgi:molecular chaperone HscC